MAIVLPHGVLFRGAAEGKIRKTLLENSAIDCIIGLPSNIFFNTSIPTTVIILKKNKEKRDVLFIDASQEFIKQKNQNMLAPEHIEKILDTYRKRETIDKYSYLAEFEEIVENDFNLNIPRYVDTFEEEEPISLTEVSKELFEINQSIADAEKELFSMFQELVGTTDEAQGDLDGLLKYFQKAGGNDE